MRYTICSQFPVYPVRIGLLLPLYLLLGLLLPVDVLVLHDVPLVLLLLAPHCCGHVGGTRPAIYNPNSVLHVLVAAYFVPMIWTP